MDETALEKKSAEVKYYGFEVAIMNNTDEKGAMEILKNEARKFFGNFLVDCGAVSFHPPRDRDGIWSTWSAKIKIVMPTEE